MFKKCLLRWDGLTLTAALLLLAANSLLLSQVATATNGDSATNPAKNQSDLQAIQALRNVLAKSGGMSAWENLRSAKEIFSISNPANPKDPIQTDATTPQAHIIHLLDDWSSEKTHYRRGVKDQGTDPVIHDGQATFTVKTGNRSIILPEFDQARILADRLPAAAAEIMLRRPEYVVKISKLQTCEINIICVDIFRSSSSVVPIIPEQQWKISEATGLPVSIRYQATSTGSSGPLWQEAYFLQYGPEQQLVIPTSIGLNVRGKRQIWTFVSMTTNPGFDGAQFDQEVGQ